MDKITGYIAVVFMSAAVTACSLDEKVYTQIDESYVTDAEMAESVLLGVYRDLNVDGIYRWNLSMMFNLPTDEAKIEGSSLVAERLEGCNAYSASSSHVQKTWAALYKAVYDANYFLEMMERRSPDFPEEDAALCDIYVAEARFLRGLLYFELVRWFGHVPLVTSTAESYLPSDQIEQADPVKVYEFIEKDLQYAVDQQIQGIQGRGSRASCQGVCDMGRLSSSGRGQMGTCRGDCRTAGDVGAAFPSSRLRTALEKFRKQRLGSYGKPVRTFFLVSAFHQ